MLRNRKCTVSLAAWLRQAYWYYIDFVRDKDPSLRNMHIARFAEMMFRRLPGFQDIADSGMVEDIVAQWRAYSAQIPRAGGILLNPTMDKVRHPVAYRHLPFPFPVLNEATTIRTNFICTTLVDRSLIPKIHPLFPMTSRVLSSRFFSSAAPNPVPRGASPAAKSARAMRPSISARHGRSRRRPASTPRTFYGPTTTSSSRSTRSRGACT